MHARKAVRLSLVASMLFLLGGCGSEDGEEEAVGETYCNPISLDHCMLPWPSSFYLKKDSSTKTGYRVSYPEEAMPKDKEGEPVSPERHNLTDGYSVGSQILAYFKSGVSSVGLPGQDDLASSVTTKSPIWVMDYTTGDKVPLFAELDANAQPGVDVPGLIIRPQMPLKYNSRYVVAIRTGLKDSEGQALQPPDPFRRLRDGLSTGSPTLEAERGRIEEVLTFLEKHGVARQDVVLAWDFHTASREAVTGNLIGMLDQALAKLPADGPAFSNIKSEDFPPGTDPYLLRKIQGEFEVPSFLESDDFDAWLKLDAAGKPVLNGTRKFPFWITIPRCAAEATGPLPVLVFGHGLFALPEEEIEGEYNKHMVEDLCMVEVAAQWRGLSGVDAASVGNSVIMDLSTLPRITDQLQQSHVNFQALVKLVQGPLLKDPSLQVAGKQVTDGKELYYLGISNGGIQGVAFSALNKEIQRFVFHVSAGWWSLMIQRSSNFQVFAVAMERIYPEVLDRLILVSLTQHLWDYTDPINFAPHVRLSPLPGRVQKNVVMQESKDDDQVPNLATRAIARTIGLDALTPANEEVFGLEQKAGPLESGYAQWNTDPPVKPPGTNVPAAKPAKADSAHDRPRYFASFRDQLKAFFKPDGKLINTCQGYCNPE
jgi:hypothetical protein